MDNRATTFRPSTSDRAAIDILQAHLLTETGIRPGMSDLLRMGLVALLRQHGLKLPTAAPAAKAATRKRR